MAPRAARQPKVRPPAPDALDAPWRLFLAVPLTEEVKALVAQQIDVLEREGWPVRWVQPEGAHLTLHFLGETTREQAELLRLAMPSVAARHALFDIRTAALGVFQAVKESPGVYLFGSNADQAHLAPERVVGSAVIDLPRAFLLVARELKEGRFTPKVESFGLESGVVRYVPNPALDSLLPAGLTARLRAAADSIAAGTLIAAPRPASMQALRPLRRRPA